MAFIVTHFYTNRSVNFYVTVFICLLTCYTMKCLHEAAKTDGIQLLDLFCEALHQNSYGRLVSTASTEVNQNSMVFPTTLSNYSGPLKGGAISRAVHYLRYLFYTSSVLKKCRICFGSES